MKSRLAAAVLLGATLAATPSYAAEQSPGLAAARPAPEASSAVAGEAIPAPAPRQPRPADPPLATASADATVTIGDFFFQAKDVTIQVGDTVTWRNTGSVREGHTATGDAFDSGVLHKGQTYSHRFSSPGTFRYICAIHPSMKGTVTVLASASSDGGSSEPAGGASGGDDAGAGDSPSSASSGSSASAPATGPGSESSAVGSPQAGGSRRTLPMTGMESLGLAGVGIALILLGFALRPAPLRRPSPPR